MATITFGYRWVANQGDGGQRYRVGGGTLEHPVPITAGLSKTLSRTRGTKGLEQIAAYLYDAIVCDGSW